MEDMQLCKEYYIFVGSLSIFDTLILHTQVLKISKRNVILV